MNEITRRSALKVMAAALGAASLCDGQTASASRPPNFVVIYCDDLGYGDLGCYGSTTIKTPRLDAMAAEGVRFTDFYTTVPVCSPSRAGLMTGRYPIRMGFNRVLFPKSSDGIDASEKTIAESLKELGYATGCVGKWHLGHLPQYLPTRHGFDYYYGIPYSNDMVPTPLMRNEETIEEPANQDLLTQRYAEEAVKFIERSKDKPFFLYLPHSMPHVPIHCSKKFRGTSQGGLYGDVIEEIDWSVGQVLDALKRMGLDKDTLVVFSSDNGPWLVKGKDGGSAGPLRNGKGTTFEGGVREPGIFWWPGRLQAGRVEHTPAINLDLLPTFVSLAGGVPKTAQPLDGKDISGLLLGNGKRDGEEFFFCMGGKLESIRSGKWKYKRPFQGKVYGEDATHGALLFDLEFDMGEKDNLADKHPDIVRSLEEKIKAFERSLEPLVPTKK